MEKLNGWKVTATAIYENEERPYITKGHKYPVLDYKNYIITIIADDEKIHEIPDIAFKFSAE